MFRAKIILNKNLCIVLGLIVGALLVGCAKAATDNKSEATATSSAPTGPFLYVSSGVCYSGGGNTTFTTATASNLVYRINTNSGIRDLLIADYFAAPSGPGDSPAGLIDWDNDNILVVVETGSGRRIERLEKKNTSDRIIFSSNTTALSAGLRSISKTADGGVLVSKATAIEKFSSLGARQTIGAATPWISAPAAPCATSTTLLSSMVDLANGKTVFLHAAAAQNRFGIISSTGYSVAGNCLVGQAAPNANSFPTAAVYLPAVSQLIVAYAGNATTTDLNSIYVYTINETTNAITGATKLIDSATSSYIYGISAMAYDQNNNVLYVATANGSSTTVNNYNIEKFTYNSTTKVLTRVGTTAWYPYGNDTKCISGMAVGTY